jgi:hypothetical protein
MKRILAIASLVLFGASAFAQVDIVLKSVGSYASERLDKSEFSIRDRAKIAILIRAALEDCKREYKVPAQ